MMKKLLVRKHRERRAVLTVVENQVWEDEFNHQKDLGCPDNMADERAWRMLQQRFPRLMSYSGCR